MRIDKSLDGWMDGWTDVAKREEKDEWYALKDLKSNDSREVFKLHCRNPVSSLLGAWHHHHHHHV